MHPKYELHPKMPSESAESPKPRVNAGYDIQGIIFIPKPCSVKLHQNFCSKLLLFHNASSSKDRDPMLHVENRLLLP